MLKRLCPQAIVPVPNLQRFHGKKFAIEISLFAYKFKKVGDGTINSILEQFRTLIAKLHTHNITPIFVFDGIPPQNKSKELEKRHTLRLKNQVALETLLMEESSPLSPSNLIIIDNGNLIISSHSHSGFTEENEMEKLEKRCRYVTKDDYDCIAKDLVSKGIQIEYSPGEGEMGCSALCMTGLVDVVVTDDTDAFAFGAPLTLRNFYSSGQEMHLISLTSILECLKMDWNTFVDTCILCGCDYTGTIKGVGSVKAFEYMKKYGSIEQLFISEPYLKKRVVEGNFDYEGARSDFSRAAFWAQELLENEKGEWMNSEDSKSWLELKE